MEDFSFVSSVVVPIIVSGLTSSATWFVAIRKSRNEHRNALIDDINKQLDELRKYAVEISTSPYSDENYHYMVYETGNLETNLLKTEKDLAKYNFLMIKKILTDHLFYAEDKKEILNQLSAAFQNVKRKLDKRFL